MTNLFSFFSRALAFVGRRIGITPNVEACRRAAFRMPYGKPVLCHGLSFLSSLFKRTRERRYNGQYRMDDAGSEHAKASLLAEDYDFNLYGTKLKFIHDVH
jgi:hypothetical protein